MSWNSESRRQFCLGRMAKEAKRRKPKSRKKRKSKIETIVDKWKHAEATYRVIPFDEGSFAIEVHIPDSYPTKISPFATEADAEAWIADHQRRIEAQMQPGGWSRRTPRMGNANRRPS